MATIAFRAVGGLATSSAFVSGFKSTTGVVTRELRLGVSDLAWRRRLVLQQQQRRNHQTFRGSPVAMMQPSPDMSASGAGERDLQPLGVVSATAPSGEILEIAYVEGVTLTSDAYAPGGLGPNADPFLSFQQGGIPPPVAGETIGQALETAAAVRGDKELTTADARAVQSAESRATGQPTVKGGPGALAQSMADKGVPMGDVLRDAAERLPVDKVVTQQDASAVQSAEQRNNEGRIEPGGVAASVQQAANFNKSIGAA